MNKFWLRRGFSSLVLALVCMTGINAHAQQTSAPEDIPAARLMQPAELAKILSSGGEKPLVLQVGSHVLFAEAHIPGSEYAGAGGTEAGLQTLRDRVKSLDHATAIVIYCGCCPWVKCPNIRAAYRQLSSLGFTNVKALYIAANFGTDWASKGYPVEKGR
jgi:rhodanese-related sulfurtransferase